MQHFSQDDFLNGLRIEVSNSFPFRNDETLDNWAMRAVQTLNTSQRAMLAVRMGTVQRSLKSKYYARKRAWITSARLDLVPSPRRACFVCGGFASIAQAHHVVPLNEQYEHGFVVPDHEHEWLCPNHHVTLHLMIDRASSTQKLGRRAAPALADLPTDQIDRLMELVTRSGRNVPLHMQKVVAR